MSDAADSHSAVPAYGIVKHAVILNRCGLHRIITVWVKMSNYGPTCGQHCDSRAVTEPCLGLVEVSSQVPLAPCIGLRGL